MEMYIPKSFRQVLALILCLAMLVPSFAVPVTAAETETTEESQGTESSGSADSQTVSSGISGMSDNVEYVSLPVTIRDFAADGMLFEFNQTDKRSTDYASMTYQFETGSLASGYDWTSNSSLGYRILTYDVYKNQLPGGRDLRYWYGVICNSDGSIKAILPSGEVKNELYAQYMTAGCFSVWMWIGDGGGSETDLKAKEAYKSFYSMVPEDNRHGCTISYNASTGNMTVTSKYKCVTIDGVNYIVGDNNGFTLLLTDSSDYINNLTDSSSIARTQVVQNDGGTTTSVTLNSGAPQTVKGGNMRLDLVEATLDTGKNVVYTEATVTYLANLLETMLQVPYTVTLGDTTYNTSYYLLGTKLYNGENDYVGKDNTNDTPTKDLADVFRACINGGRGTYANAKARFDAGELSMPKDVDTYYEAAYYLLHSLWRDNATEGYAGDDGYGWNTWNYNKIHLVQTTNANGEKCYVFNSGYDDTKYDPVILADGQYTGSGAIYNTQVEKITAAQHPDGNGGYTGGEVYSSGVILPNARFDPLGTSGSGKSFGYGMDAGTYCELMKAYPDRGELFYPVTNYHLSLEGHAKFIYYKDANQFFTFTGDDDVYLYINGKRVLDLGGAHAIAKVSINLNDVAALCGLSDGMTYDFDFYYMERHGTAANFGIETNIQIVDPSMLTTKTGYQNGQPTGYNGYVNPDIPVTYEFGLENNGEAAVQNLTFADPTIGISLTKDTISLNSLTTMDDLSVTLYGSDGAVKSSVAAGSLEEDVLMDYLAAGLEVGEKIVIHGFSYKISNDDWDCRFTDNNGNGVFDEGDTQNSNWYFFNIIYTTATAVGENNSTKELTGTSNWVVQKLEDGKLGNLTITKQLDEDASDALAGRTYTMQVLFDGKPVPVGTAYAYTLQSGEKVYRTVENAGQIPLEVGATATLRAASGTTFQVCELIDSKDREVYRATYQAVSATASDTGVTGTITENSEASVTVTNHTIPASQVETNKYVTANENDPNKFTLTLESYVKGELANVSTTTPADFVLVLDQSASMYAPAGDANGYDNSQIIGNLSSTVPVANLDTTKAQHMGYYIAQSNSGREVSNADGTKTTFYDWFVVQHIDGKWYYVRKDKTAMPATIDTNYSGNTNEIGETLVRGEPITHFNYYQSGYGALYDAVTGFVDNLKATGVDHRVAVVGFASPFYDAMEFFDGSGVYVNGNYYLYDVEYLKDESGNYYTYTLGDRTKVYLTDDQYNALPKAGANTVYDQALVSVQSGSESIKASLNAVTTNYWHTCPAAGLDMANNIFDKTPANGRNRTVLLFTDGEPTIRIGANYGQSDNYTDKDEEGLDHPHKYWTVVQGKDNAIELANITKNTYGANIHTIGTAGAGADTLFLNAVSSDYPKAEYYPTTYTDDDGNVLGFEDDGVRQPTEEEIKAGMGDPIAEPMFSHFVSDELPLTKIFEEILESTTSLKLGADAVLKEVLTDYFDLESGTVTDIEVYTAPYNGNGSFGEKSELEGASVTLSSSDGSGRLDTVEVTGFDYAGEYISEEPRDNYYGSKLIVEVQIKTREGFWGGNNVPTNENTTAIYEKDGDLVDKFPEPQVNVPLSLTLKSDDAVVYYGSGALSGGLLTELTAGGQNVVIRADGTLAPQADWMDDYATLTWNGEVAPNAALSTTEPGEYTYSATLVPKTNGETNTSSYPSNIAGEKVSMSGITAADSSVVDVLVPVIPFKDSTITQGENPDDSYFDSINLVDEEIRWVLIDDTANTKTATHGSAPALSFVYKAHTNDGAYVEATPVDVTVSAQYDSGNMDFTGVSYFDWKTCNTNLHDEGTIALHAGSTANQNEFWIHVAQTPDGGLVTDKYVTATEDANAFELTLEAYALGEQNTVTITKPADIVLVLDHSGSMRTPVGAPEVLHSPNEEGYEGALYEGTGAMTYSELDTTLGQHTGYYVAQSQSSKTWFVVRYDADSSKWFIYSVPSTESIVNIQYESDTKAKESGGWTEHTQTQSWSVEQIANGGAQAFTALKFYQSQYAVLYDAVKDFVGDLKATGAEHRVAIVGFAGSTGDGSCVYIGGDETAIKSYDAMYHVNTTESRRTELYQKALKSVQDADEYELLLNSIEAIETNYSFTCPSAGLKMAADLFTANEANLADRDRIVVLFTDGIPNKIIGGDETTSETQNDIYNEIVSTAYNAKQQGAQIYSISTTTLGTGADRTFLSYASSDYPNATSYSDPGSPISSLKYTEEIGSGDALNAVFSQITENVVASAVNIDETAVMREVLSDYIQLDADATVQCEVFTQDYLGNDTWGELKSFNADVVTTPATGRVETIEVSGFDYADNYVSEIVRTDPNDSSNTAYRGRKLVLKVYVESRTGFWGGNNVPTNKSTTAVYFDGNVVKPFPEPEVNVPIHVTVEAKDKTIYYDGNVDTDNDGKEGDELITKVTIGGQEVTVNNDGTFTPKESWMDDFASASWDEDSTKPDSDLSNREPKDYTYTVTVTPNSDGTTNTQDNPSNIAGNVDGGTVNPEDLTESSEKATDTGHIFILVPELTFKDSTTDFGTPTEGYDYTNQDYVDTKWVFMEDTKDTTNAPAVSGEEPELTLTYTPNTDDVQDGSFVTDTKVDVTVSIGELDITNIVNFDWQDCEHDVADIDRHKGNENINEFWVHVALSIVPDTVVIDYGLDVVIDVLANDPKKGTIVPELTGIGAENATSFGTAPVNGEFGQLSIDGSNVRYALNISNGMQINKEEAFTYQATYTIKDQPKALSTTVTVIPATTIYYEDSFVDFTVWNNSNFEVNMDSTKQWVDAGSTGNADQAQDRPGDGLSDVDADNIYGYDGAYTNMAEYSLGSAKKVTVNQDLFAEAQFTFYGTGFDIISLTSNTTGTILVDVFKAADFKENSYAATPVESHMVDTYYGYQYTLCNVSYLCTGTDSNGKPIWERSVDSVAESATAESNVSLPANPSQGDTVSAIEYDWIVDDDANGTLYQVPVMKVSGLEYGQYTALITVSYSSGLDHQNSDGNNSYDFYLDAIRIYDPANDGADSDVIEKAYVADGEGWPEYFELRNLIISKNDFDSLKDGTGEGIVFIDNTLDSNKTWTYTISDYTNFGPNNELYLASGQAAAFQLTIPDNVAGIHLAMKSVGGTAKVAVYDAADNTNTSVTPTTIATATDLYYDITSLNNKTVVITNTGESGDAILSITNVKVTYETAHTDSLEKGYFTVNQTGAQTAMESLAMMHAPSIPDVPDESVPEETVPETTEPEVTEPEVTEPEDAESENPFKDVPDDSYYTDAVLWAVENGITAGYGNSTTFAPVVDCTRGQIVTFLWRAAGEPEPVSKTNPFKDVKKNDYFYKAVLWAVEQGITNGYGSDSTFAPNLPCTRGQVATFLHRYFGEPAPASSSNPFKDVKSNEFYYTPVLWAVGEGITAGYGNASTFAPNLPCNRAQIVTFLYRAMQ